MIIRSRAPLRLSFGGGGTDVSPYMDERGGAVLSVTIDKYAYASMRVSGGEPGMSVHSLDYDVVAKYAGEDDLKFDGSLDLVKAVLKRMKSNGEDKKSLEFFLHSDAPPGSGLGSSSTMAVAMLGLFRHWKNLPLTDYDMAELAWEIERIDLGIAGGRQDQYAAVFGGVNFIEFSKQAVVVNALRVKPEVLNELQYTCLLCYTGRTRMGDNIIRQQADNFRKGNVDAVAAMDEIKRIAVEMKAALLQGRLRDFAALLHEGWESKKRMAGKISTSHIDEMYTEARKVGALGGKVTGAGGGGYMLFICEFDKKHKVAEKLEQMGGQIVEFAFDYNGLQTWSTDG
ncbi:MAG: GHMP kinase [Planctomycetes bacterium]|nr:GHMP kinase [Planctomycetota bacterium]